MTTSTLTWDDTQDQVLTQSQQLNNAQLIANHFAGKWSANAISALCGNAHVESYVNPNTWESGQVGDTTTGFGLVQWTPASKLIDWCNSQSKDYTKGDAQLDRIDYEKANGIQWIQTSTYPISFADWAQSTDSVDNLTAAWMYNYERPASYSSLSERQSFANTCFTSLDFSGGGSSAGTTPRRQTVAPATEAPDYEKEGKVNNMTYVEVKKGDTLSGLASKYGVRASAVKRVRFENIANPNVLLPGEVLLLPKSDMSTPKSTSRLANTYTVKPGDNLTKIAKIFGTTVDSLARANNLKDPDVIKAGQVLKV